MFAVYLRQGLPGEVHGAEDERLVHGQDDVAVAVYAALFAQGLLQCCAEAEADVLHAVVRVDVQIALAADCEVKAAVQRKQRQHVVEEADAGVYLGPARAVQLEAELDGGLRRLAADFTVSHVLSSVSISRPSPRAARPSAPACLS